MFDASPSAHAQSQFDDQKARDFDSVLLGTIEDVLRRVFSDLSVELILQHVERGRALKREEIPTRVAAFALALHEIFGEGSALLERSILGCLHSRLGLKLEGESHGFTDQVEELRRRFA